MKLRFAIEFVNRKKARSITSHLQNALHPDQNRPVIAIPTSFGEPVGIIRCSSRGAVKIKIAPGTYVLRLSGAQDDNMETRLSCELVGIDTVTLHVMSVGMMAGAPAIFATAPTEFMYVHAVR